MKLEILHTIVLLSAYGIAALIAQILTNWIALKGWIKDLPNKRRKLRHRFIMWLLVDVLKTDLRPPFHEIHTVSYIQVERKVIQLQSQKIVSQDAFRSFNKVGLHNHILSEIARSLGMEMLKKGLIEVTSENPHYNQQYDYRPEVCYRARVDIVEPIKR